ncbi:hypothetical protein [Microbispora hainanensis]
MERQIDGVVLHGKMVPVGDDLPVPGTPLEYLTAEAAALIYDGVAENTRTAYRRAWTQFESWCEQYGFTPMPCGELTLANYVGSSKLSGVEESAASSGGGAAGA